MINIKKQPRAKEKVFQCYKPLRTAEKTNTSVTPDS